MPAPKRNAYPCRFPLWSFREKIAHSRRGSHQAPDDEISNNEIIEEVNNHSDRVLEDPDQDQISLVEVELVAENFEYCVSFEGIGIPAPVEKDAAAYPY